MTYLLFIPIIILISLSAFFSASEMVFSSANKLRLENAAENNVPGAKLALKIANHFDDTLSAVLVGNNLVNIATSSIGSLIAISLWGEGWTWVMTVLLTVLVIIFGETMPKIIAKKNANKLVLILCYPIRFLTIILKPVTLIIVGLVNLIMLLLPKPKQEKSEEEAQMELQSIIETAEDENVLDEDQSEMMQAALEFDDIMVQEIMTARVDIDAINIEDDWDEIMETAELSGYSRLPVYEETIDQVIGVLSQTVLYRLLTAGKTPDLRSLLNEPVYLYKTTRLPIAINTLRSENQNLAFVVDEYGGTMGIVTVEDIMEQLVGEIRDEKDIEEQDEVVEHDRGMYELDGDMQISDFAELMGWNEEELELEIESVTVGGMTTELYGTFPNEGEIVHFRNVEMQVIERDRLRVSRILVTVFEEEESDESED